MEKTNEPKEPLKVGRLFLKGEEVPLFNGFGEVNDTETKKVKFGLAFTEEGFHPVVVSFETDQAYLLEWSDILRLAIDAGIDNLQLAPAKEEPKETPKIWLPGG